MAKLTPYQESALKSDIHISLTANAGSGKTFVLSKRYVDIALTKVKSLNEMVAITFTEKAAGELSKKISNEIEERATTETEPATRKKLVSLRRQLVSANISTIHSFCINILKEFSPEAGIDANFIPLDPETADELIELTLDEVYRDTLGDENESERLKNLVRLLGSKSLLFKELKTGLGSRKKYFDLSRNLYDLSAGEIASRFREIFEKLFTEIFEPSISILTEVIEKINSAVESADPQNEIAEHVNSLLGVLAGAKEPLKRASLVLNLCDSITTSGNTLKKMGYTKKVKGEDFEYESGIISEIIGDLGKLEIPENVEESELKLAEFGKNFLWFFGKILDGYTDKKYRSGYLDFEDILLFTRELLAKREVQEVLAQKFRYIMIDEYQDTNEIQYEIFMPMLDNLKKNNLFVVGDEKQSIYRFRDADLSVFRQTRDDIISAKNEEGILNLPHSFRVSPPIALLVNKIFTHLFANPVDLFNEVGHSDLLVARGKDEAGSITLLLNNAKNEESLAESEAVAGEILEIVKSGERQFGDIAILSKRRVHFGALESSFIKHKIPFTIMGGRGFYQNQVVYDIYNYLSFLLNDKNDAALVGVLRSPFFLITDMELYKISTMEGSSFYQKMANFYDSADNSPVAILSKHLKIAKRINLRSLLSIFLDETGYWASAAANDPSGLTIANLEKLINLAGTYAGQGMKTLYDFVFYLEDAIQNMTEEPQADIVKDENTVKIMTVHQSKGLEFDTVILFGANDTLRNDNVRSRGVSVDPAFGVLTKVPPGDDYFAEYVSPPVNGVYNYINERKNIAEIKRLFYVAVTRAVNHLIISSTHKDFSIAKGSFLGYFVEGTGIDPACDNSLLSGEIEFMGPAEDNFKRSKSVVSTEIKIKQDPLYSFEPVQSEIQPVVEQTIHVEKIGDTQSGEIISATKIAIYKQCPVKYKLTYELGYSGLLASLEEENFPRLSEPAVEEKSEEQPLRADIAGTIAHALLEKNVKLENLHEFLERHLTVQEYKHSLTKSETEAIRVSVSGIIENFLKTGIAEELNSFSEYKNEFEIYVKPEDYYLYGIIDKFIDTNDRYIIVDYKTDEVSEKNAEEKLVRYLPQLKFYAVLVNLLRGVKKTEVKLLFLKRPELSRSQILEPMEIKEFGDEIKSIIYDIRAGNFKKNLDHCFACYFSEKGKCPIK